jgi:hypothetical protein
VGQDQQAADDGDRNEQVVVESDEQQSEQSEVDKYPALRANPPGAPQALGEQQLFLLARQLGYLTFLSWALAASM